MSSSLYIPLKEGLLELAHSISTDREASFSQTPLSPALPPIPPSDLTNQVKAVWEQSQSEEGSSNGRWVEIVRSVLDLLGRDMVVTPFVNGDLFEPEDGVSDEERCRFQTAMRDRLDIVLTLYERVENVYPDAPALEPGAIFIPLLEELVELISVETWRDLWSYVETRSKRFTKDMPASKGKALPLLRIINAFLRFLPRIPADLVFRGRVHQFASSVISVADKSAINMRGDYNDIKTTWEETLPVEEAKEEAVEADGDVSMQGADKEEVKDDKGEANGDSAELKPEPDFYLTLWSLQQYFAHPPSLDGPATRSDPDEPPRTPFEQFKIKSDFVLPKLFEQTQREKEMMGKEVAGSGNKRKRAVEDEGQHGFFHPRYLTGKRLLEHELADLSFRRQILVQYFILFQFLLNLTPATASKQAFTGGMPKTFVIDQESETWVKAKVAAIREELRKMLPDGPRFEETVLSIITRERHYAQWKNDGCPETVFEIPPIGQSFAEEAAQGWKKRLAPPPQYPFKVGSRSLSRLWNRGFTSIDQLKGWKRATSVQSLDEEIQNIEMEEADDKAMGREPTAEEVPDNAERKTNRNWRALRLAAATDLRHFSSLAAKRDIHILVEAVQGAQEVKKAASTAEDEKSDDEDVEGLKRASKEPTTGKSAESVEEVKQAESPVADVKMEVADEVKDDAVVREGKAEAAVAEIAGSDEVAADVRTGEGGNQAVELDEAKRDVEMTSA